MFAYLDDILRGLFRENPTLRLLIGMCPVLAVTTMAINGLIMGIAVVAVLVCSSFIISACKNIIPNQVRIPIYIVIIATFVTIADLLLAALVPDVHKVLGLFVPLIVVNCIILGRAEAFASKMPVLRSITDGLGMGLGFTWALVFIGCVRELLGRGSVFGVQLMGEAFVPWEIMQLPPGAFLTMGTIVFVLNLAGQLRNQWMQKSARAKIKLVEKEVIGG
ncbi:MAG: electron transport complex subunit E [Clostridia bacterium]|jgi:electron transport complex protein RnfE|nr:electron transport complex subunit E [Clostridia bacterium]